MIKLFGDKRAGFSCWDLFTINYFRCYEVSNVLFVDI